MICWLVLGIGVGAFIVSRVTLRQARRESLAAYEAMREAEKAEQASIRNYKAASALWSQTIDHYEGRSLDDY